jgi:hypothetical protein
MEKIKTNKGFYTQNIDELPIEERVFFTEGIVANANDFRFATEQEVEDWKEYLKKQEEEL